MEILSLLLMLYMTTFVYVPYFINIHIVLHLLLAMFLVSLEVAVLFVFNFLVFKTKDHSIIGAFNLCIVTGTFAWACYSANREVTAVAVALAVVTALAFDLFGRCFANIIKRERYIPGRIVFSLSTIWIALVMTVLCSKGIGHDFSKYYGQLAIDAQRNVNVPQLDDDKGKYRVGTFTYGDREEYDITSDSMDMTSFELEQPIKKMKMNYLFGTDFSAVPVNGKIWYPIGAKNRPVLFIVHGAHEAATPSHLGYDYLGQYLASNGYVVVSVDENILNVDGDNSSRALLLLENMKQVLAWNKDEYSLIYNLIDEEKICMAGHSRGGESVALAYLLNDYTSHPDNGNVNIYYHIPIKGIIAIAPTVDQDMPSDRSVRIGDVNYLMIHGSHDQDVVWTMGEKQYENIYFTGDKKCFKALVYVYGANHGQFNEQWGLADASGPLGKIFNMNNFLEEKKQQEVLKILVKAFLDTVLSNNPQSRNIFYDIDLYSDSLPLTAYQEMYYDSDMKMLCDFEDNVDMKSSDDSRISIDVDGAGYWRKQERTLGHYVKQDRANHVLEVKTRLDNECVVHINLKGMDIREKAFCIDIADMTEGEYATDDLLNYSVTLVDSQGHTAQAVNIEPVYSSLKLDLQKLETLTNTYEYKHQFETVCYKPTDFDIESNFDLGHIREVQITFHEDKKLLLFDNIALKDLNE